MITLHWIAAVLGDAAVKDGGELAPNGGGQFCKEAVHLCNVAISIFFRGTEHNILLLIPLVLLATNSCLSIFTLGIWLH